MYIRHIEHTQHTHMRVPARLAKDNKNLYENTFTADGGKSKNGAKRDRR